MSSWRRFPKPAEPNENKGGFRRVKRGEGAARVFGGSDSKEASNLEMISLAVVFGLLALSVPVSFLLKLAFGYSWADGVYWGGLALTHFFMMGAEMVTHREIPGRNWGMLLCWGTFLVRLVVAAAG